MENSYISQLQAKHQAIDAQIRAMMGQPAPDSVKLAQLKKRKLRLKEAISR